MFGLGMGEIVILVIVGLFFIGPDELPKVLRAVSQFVRKLTGAKEEWMKTFRDDPTLRDITDSVNEVKEAVNKPRVSLEEALRDEMRRQEKEDLEKKGPHS